MGTLTPSATSLAASSIAAGILPCHCACPMKKPFTVIGVKMMASALRTIGEPLIVEYATRVPPDARTDASTPVAGPLTPNPARTWRNDPVADRDVGDAGTAREHAPDPFIADDRRKLWAKRIDALRHQQIA